MEHCTCTYFSLHALHVILSTSGPAPQSDTASRPSSNTLEYQQKSVASKEKGTPEYQRVMTNLSSITTTLQLNPPASQRLRLKFKEKECTASPTEEQLITHVLGRIEQDVNQFGEFIAMLCDIEGMDLLVNTLTGMTCDLVSMSLLL